MRIISGALGGRSFDSPNSSATHPMSDKIRGALFNVLGDIEGLTVLDAFTGSGAIAYEAISRGAKTVIAIDERVEPIAVVKRNSQKLGITDRLTAVRADCTNWLAERPSLSFDIVVCDPPYDRPQLDVVTGAMARTSPGGIAIVSLPPDITVAPDPRFELLRSKSYGDARLYFYRKV